jgi:hypothetical protein
LFSSSVLFFFILNIPLCRLGGKRILKPSGRFDPRASSSLQEPVRVLARPFYITTEAVRKASLPVCRKTSFLGGNGGLFAEGQEKERGQELLPDERSHFLCLHVVKGQKSSIVFCDAFYPIQLKNPL